MGLVNPRFRCLLQCARFAKSGWKNGRGSSWQDLFHDDVAYMDLKDQVAAVEALVIKWREEGEAHPWTCNNQHDPEQAHYRGKEEAATELAVVLYGRKE